MKVSVIIPVFNRVGTLKKAIQSVLDQSYPIFELVIVDDCSTLDIKQVVEGFQDDRLVFLRMEKNTGAAAARNQGIRQSKGSIISFLDSDDFLEPGFLEETIRVLSNTPPQVGYMWTGVRFHLKSKTRESMWIPTYNNNPYITFLDNLQIGAGGGISIKREVFEKCGYFNADLPASEDTDFFLRISQMYEYRFSSKILINIKKDTPDRMSRKFHDIATAYNIFLPKHFSEIDKNPRLQLKYYYKMMWLNYHLDDKKKARAYYKKVPVQSGFHRLKVIFTRFLYELLPINMASLVHQKLSANNPEEPFYKKKK